MKNFKPTEELIEELKENYECDSVVIKYNFTSKENIEFRHAVEAPFDGVKTVENLNEVIDLEEFKELAKRTIVSSQHTKLIQENERLKLSLRGEGNE